ncbi:MAG: hypothetical protein C0403_08810, partial [Desulfobacterium sp.]|nr:hypothetical protein [Desulfobacterium sp.]
MNTNQKSGKLGKAGVVIALIVLMTFVTGCGISRKLNRIWMFSSLFDEPEIVENFRSLPEYCPYHLVKKGEKEYRFAEARRPLPETFVFNNQT